MALLGVGAGILPRVGGCQICQRAARRLESSDRLISYRVCPPLRHVYGIRRCLPRAQLAEPCCIRSLGVDKLVVLAASRRFETLSPRRFACPCRFAQLSFGPPLLLVVTLEFAPAALKGGTGFPASQASFMCRTLGYRDLTLGHSPPLSWISARFLFAKSSDALFKCSLRIMFLKPLIGYPQVQ